MEQKLTPVQVIAHRVRQVRKRRDMTAEDLAQELTSVGVEWKRATVAKLENGLRENVTVTELLALSVALQVAPAHLLVPPDQDDALYQVAPKRSYPVRQARAFVRGHQELPGMNWQDFMTEMPESDVIEYAAGRKQFVAELDQGGDDDGPGG